MVLLDLMFLKINNALIDANIQKWDTDQSTKKWIEPDNGCLGEGLVISAFTPTITSVFPLVQYIYIIFHDFIFISA